MSVFGGVGLPGQVGNYLFDPALPLYLNNPVTESVTGAWDPTASKPKEKPQVENVNSKAYKVVLVSESEPRIVLANDVSETNGRLKFVGSVEGQSNYSGCADVVASFLSENVSEYGVVPVPDVPTVGRNTYRITFTDATTVDVVADRVLYTQGTEKDNGQFTLVTNEVRHETRTEYVVGENLVKTISRVTDGDTVPVPAQTGGEAVGVGA